MVVVVHIWTLSSERCEGPPTRTLALINAAPSATTSDAYDFDSPVHDGYEHSVPKDPSASERRMVIIMRAGDSVSVDADTGRPAPSLQPPIRKKAGPVFGSMPDRITEGARYTREYILRAKAHCQQQKGVSGNQERGCDAVVVSRQSDFLRETDRLDWLRYSSNGMQGSRALLRSLVSWAPVFRNSMH